jgi:hypothetical protein
VKGQPREGIEYVWSVYFCAANLYLSSGTERLREVTYLRGERTERNFTVSFHHFDVTYSRMPETIDCPYETLLHTWARLRFKRMKVSFFFVILSEEQLSN